MERKFIISLPHTASGRLANPLRSRRGSEPPAAGHNFDHFMSEAHLGAEHATDFQLPGQWD